MSGPNYLRFDTLALHAGQAPDPQSARAPCRSTDHVLRLPRRRPRRLAVQHGARRPCLLAYLQPDQRGAGGAHRRAGRRCGAIAVASGQAALHLAIATLMGADRTSSPRVPSTEARITCLSTRCRASASRPLSSIRAASGVARSHPAQHAVAVRRNTGNPGLDVSTFLRCRQSRTKRVFPSWSTPPSPRPTSCGRSTSAPICSITRRPSFSVATVLPSRACWWTVARLTGGVRQVSRAHRALRGLSWHGLPGGVDRRRIPAPGPPRRSARFRRLHEPHDAFQILQGIETLPLRVQRHVENTRRVIEFLKSPPPWNPSPIPNCRNTPTMRWRRGCCRAAAVPCSAST